MSSRNNPNALHHDEALAWAMRLDDRPLSPREQTAFSEWLAADPEHPAQLQEMRRFTCQVLGTMPSMAAAGGWSIPQLTRPRAPRFRILPVLAAAAAIALIAIWQSGATRVLETANGERSGATLADGTHVDLNARTSLSVSIDRKERRLQLAKGEAYFDVAKDAARPFIVESSAGSVRVLGTRFNVRASKSGEVEVTVLEGSVSVSPPRSGRSDDVRLVANDSLLLGAGPASVRPLEAKSARDSIAWREGKIAFQDTPLNTALARFDDYHSLRVTVAPEIAGLLLGGRYTLDDFDEFLSSLEGALPVRVLRGPGIVRIVPI